MHDLHKLRIFFKKTLRISIKNAPKNGHNKTGRSVPERPCGIKVVLF